MSTTPPIDSVAARIGSIRSRFEPHHNDQQIVVEGEEFDPFGATYQQAISAVASSRQPQTAVAAPQRSAVATRLTESLYPIRASAGVSRPAGVAVESTAPIVSAAIAGRAGAPGARPIGGYGSLPVPASLAAHGNGRVPVDELTPIAQRGHRLYAPAAAAWDSLVSEAAAHGFELKITDSYRTFGEQVDLVARKGLYSEGGLAARPGTSNHGWGLAVDADLTDPALLDWVRTNGPRFGFVEAVPREPWHWEFRPSQV